MASLTGQKIKDTYQSLLKTNDNGLVTNAFKNITDGSGSSSGLYLKNDGILLSGSVVVSGSLNATSITASLQGTSSFAISASWAPNLGGIPGGSDTQIQFNSGSAFEGDADFTYDYVSSSLAQGNSVTATGQYSHAEGQYTFATGIASHAEGSDTIAIGDHSNAKGYYTRTGTYNAYSASIIQGIVTMSAEYGDITGDFPEEGVLYFRSIDYVEGFSDTISQSYYDVVNGNTILELYNTNHVVTTYPAYVGLATAINAGVLDWAGNQTIAATGAHAAGAQNVALGPYSHVEGRHNNAIGTFSHAEGGETRAIGDGSHSEGTGTKAIGPSSHAEGGGTKAIGEASHAEGTVTQAIGRWSHAEGISSTAIGQGSHAEGGGTITIGFCSHTEGQQTIASGSYQHVSGQFNQHDNTSSLFVVGIGLDDSNRKDGFTVDVDANGSGSIMIPSCIDFPENSKMGSMYFDPVNEYLWIYTGVNWRYTPLQAIVP